MNAKLQNPTSNISIIWSLMRVWAAHHRDQSLPRSNRLQDFMALVSILNANHSFRDSPVLHQATWNNALKLSTVLSLRYQVILPNLEVCS